MQELTKGIAFLSLAGLSFGCGAGTNKQNRTIDLDHLVSNPSRYSKEWYCKEVNIVQMISGPEHIVPVEGYLRYIGKGKVPGLVYKDPYCHLYRLHSSESPDSKSIPVMVLLFEPESGKAVSRETLVPEGEKSRSVSFKADLYSIPEWFSPSKMGIESEKDSKDAFVLWLDPKSKDAKFKLK